MKKLILLLSLLSLASCGGGGGGGSASSDRTSTESLETEEIIECFDDALGWIDTPPESYKAALESIEGTDLSECGGHKEMGLYIKEINTEKPDTESEEKK